MGHIKVIVKGKWPNLKDVTTKAGTCNEGDCKNRPFTMLQRHYRTHLKDSPHPHHHLPQATSSARGRGKAYGGNKDGKIETIIKGDWPDEKDVYTGEGHCFEGNCNGALKKRLKAHYVGHLRGMKLPGSVNVLEAGIDYAKEDVITTTGYCNMCQKRYVSLQVHWLSSLHKGAKWTCIICNQKVSITYKTSHLRLHTNPVKCSKCRYTGPHLHAGVAHFIREHVKEKHFAIVRDTGEAMDEEESEDDYEMDEEEVEDDYEKDGEEEGVEEMEIDLKDEMDIDEKGWASKLVFMTDEEAIEYHKQRAAREGRRAKLRAGKTAITGGRDLMINYKEDLDKPGTEVNLQMESLKKLFADHFPNFENAIVSYHASYVSVYNAEAKIPTMVFEQLRKKKESTNYESPIFFTDPNLKDHPQPSKDDYLRSGFTRGHLASSADFCELGQALPSYCYANITPTYKEFNFLVRKKMEEFIRELADEDEDNPVIAIHFPFLEGTMTIGESRVHVPTSIATIIITTDGTSRNISSWELMNSRNTVDYRDYTRDPFYILTKAKFKMNYDREDFAYVSDESPIYQQLAAAEKHRRIIECHDPLMRAWIQHQDIII